MKPLAVALIATTLISIAACRTKPDPSPDDRPASRLVISDHLSNLQVNSIAEDSESRIWIGTFRGLNRDDVHDFHQYFCSGDSLGLPDNQINAVFCDSKDRLWTLTINGVALYTKQGDFRRIPQEDRNRNCTQCFETMDGMVCFASADALSFYDERCDSIRTLLTQTSSMGGSPQYCTAPDGKIWAVSMQKIACIDPSDFRILSLTDTRHPVYHICMDSNGMLWMSGLGKLSALNSSTSSFIPLPQGIRSRKELMDADIDLIFDTKDGRLLLNTIAGGMFCYDIESDTVIRENEAGFPYDIPDFRISTIFRDSRGNVWFGSRDQGVEVSYLNKNRFSDDKYLASLFSRKTTISVADDGEGNLWLSTLNDGLYIYRLGEHKEKRIDFEKFVSASEMGYIRCSSVFIDSRKRIWLLIKDKHQVLKCSYDGEKLRLDKAFGFFAPMSIAESSGGKVVIGGFGRELSVYDEDSESFGTIDVYDGKTWTFITAIAPVPGQDKVLVGAFNQPMAIADLKHGSASLIHVGEDDLKNSIKQAVFIPNDIHVDSKGECWIGTVSNGLLHYSTSSGRLSPVEGTPSMDITAILEDKSSNLWVSTMHGLGKYDRSSGKFTNYFEPDGLGGNQFFDRSGCTLEDGTIAFGGNHGITKFRPSDIGRRISSPLVFEDLKVHNAIIRPAEDRPIDRMLSLHPDIVLDYDQNSFSITFTALDYNENNSICYSFILEGYEDYWVESGYGNEAYYANVPAGRYTFRTRAINKSSGETVAEDSLNVRVKPAPLRSPLAITIYVLLASVIALLFYRQYRKSANLKLEAAKKIRAEREAKHLAESEKQQLERLNRQQENFFANVAHEFRTPLTMIASPVKSISHSEHISGNDRTLLNIVSRNVNWMLHLVGQLLDFNKGDKLSLHVSKKDISSTINEAVELFIANAESKNIDLTVLGIEDPLVMWFDTDKLSKIIVNLMSNAMKFTPSGGKVTLLTDVISRKEAETMFELRSDDTEVQYAKICISDTGPGIPDGQKEKVFERYWQLDDKSGGHYNWGSGIGLYYSRMLAQLHHGYIKVSDREDGMAGSVFCLLIPAGGLSYSAAEKESAGTQDMPLMGSLFTSVRTNSENGEDKTDRKHILVVDDDIDVANYLKLLLADNYRVDICFDADSAVRMMEEDAPDVLISDVVMPGKTGLDLCRSVKNDLQLSHIPVILVTAKTMIESQVEGLNAGADAYVTKPFDPSYLTALIKSTLDNRSKLRHKIGNATEADEVDSEALSPQDRAFLDKLYELMDKELSNSELDVSLIAEKMKISRTKFYYKVKGLTGESPSVFFKRYKLNRAAALILEGEYNISEIADMTGFYTLSHFSTSFKKQFGMPPSEYKG